MDPGVAIAIGFLWFLFNVFGKKKKPGETRPTQRSPHPPAARPSGLPSTAGADPTQREGVRLQDLLRELGRTLDQSAGPRGRPASTRLPPAEEVEDRTSLESTPEVRSLEEIVRRPQRVEIDSDDQAEALIARRRAAAEAYAHPLRRADHVAFDARIRQEPADATSTPGTSMRRLRDAVVWREILGPPIALRDPADQ